MEHPFHTPVLFQEAMTYLAVRPGGIYLDATCGAGGHAAGIAERLGGSGRLIALDRDPAALAIAKPVLARFGNRVTLVQQNFSGADRILDELKIESIDGALADLGVSSMQLEDPSRGFSFDSEVELDMRMDPTEGIDAARLIRKVKQAELARILRDFGEQPYAGRIARAVCEAAALEQPLTGKVLREVVLRALPPVARRRKRLDPATRVFMALRIAVNDELAALESFLDRIVGRLRKGGRLVVISFHSLEDRIVKHFFAQQARGCICPKELPVCVCKKTPTLKVLTRKPVTAGQREQQDNPRARSAKLRAAQRLE